MTSTNNLEERNEQTLTDIQGLQSIEKELFIIKNYTFPTQTIQ
jgi:hypothetical protein